MNESYDRGDLSRAQVQQLLRPVNPSRVVTGSHVKPHLSQQDVVAHLIRVFGFGHFDIEVVESRLLFEEPTTNNNNKPAWNVGYLARVRLTVRDERQQLVATYEGGSTGESDGQPSRADSHDLAFKSALSTATKRAAIHLGDQFGLSLYNKGQMEPLVRGTMVGVPAREDTDVQEGVAQQEEDGGAVADRQDAAAEASQETPPAPAGAPAKRANTGTQGTKRKRSAPVDKPAAPKEAASAPQEPEKPAEGIVDADMMEEAPSEPQAEPDPAEEADRIERERIAAEQEAAARAADEAPEEPAKPTGNLARNADALPGETEPEYQHRKLQERQRAKLDERLAAEPAAPAPEYRDAVTGQTFPTQGALDEAIKVRHDDERTRESLASWDLEQDKPALASAYEVASAEEFGQDQPNYERLVEACVNQRELRDMYDKGVARGEMTTAVRALVVRRKGELPE